MIIIPSKEKLFEYLGSDLGVSCWLEVTQEDVNCFSDVTRDHQYIHTEPKKAKLTPFGGTIAHGFLSLSMLSYFAQNGCGITVKNTQMSVNYGFNKVRFINPVKVGSRIRARSMLSAIDEKKSGEVLLTLNIEVEIENVKKPALIAEWLIMLVL